MSEETEEDCWNILLCVTGSVAAIKVPLLIQSLIAASREAGKRVVVKVCMTDKAVHFCKAELVRDSGAQLYLDSDEWTMWQNRGDPVLHIQLTKWAHLLLLAPLDANSLAKLANGISDNLVTCCARAWDPRKPLVFCPAMNTQMWKHPVTSTHLSALSSWGYKLLEPISKTLMCGDTGVGAMMEPHDIVTSVLRFLDQSPLKL